MPTSTRPPSGEYLIAFSTRLTSTWRTLSASAATCGTLSGASTSSVTDGGACLRVDSTTRSAGSPPGAPPRPPGEAPALERLGFGGEPAPVELVRERDLVHDPAEPLGF